MSFPRYPKYKDSGVEWLGEVPEHWEVKPLKAIASFNDEVLPENFSADEEIEYVDIGSVSLAGGIERTETMGFGAAPSRARRKVRDGDVIASTVRTYLKAIAPVISPSVNLIVSTGFAVIRPGAGLLPPFAKFALQTNYFVDAVISRSTGVSYPAINASEMAAIPIAFPDLVDQAAIAVFLDRETAKIDELVTEQRRLMELLKEKRQAVISHAVTRGLNPDSSMKPSGVEWFDAVPSHWGRGPLKRFWFVVDCKHVTVPFLDEGIPIASIMEVRSFDLDLSKALRTSEEYCNLMVEGGRRPRRGDVIYCRNTANTGTSAFVGTDELMALGQDVCLIRSPGNCGRYLNYILHSGFMAAQLATLMIGSTFKRINVADIRELLVPCPPPDEQAGIARYLDSKTAEFELLTAEAQRAIDLLQERRTALISAAVTGQIDVRELAGEVAG